VVGFTIVKRFISSMPPAERFILLVVAAMFLAGVWLAIGEVRNWQRKRAEWANPDSISPARRPKKAA
jgi:hypothetical protein